MKVAALIAGFFVSVVPAFATNYYVDNTNRSASDSNPGTGASPWRTISRCAAKTLPHPVAGDTCEVLYGTYDERPSITNTAGSSGNVITYDGNSKSATVRGFTVGENNIRIQNFNISNCKDSSHTPGSVCSSAMASDGLASINIANGVRNFSAYSNHIYDTTSSCIYNGTANNTLTFLHANQNSLDYCGEQAVILPTAGTNLKPNMVLVTAGVNDQLSFTAQGVSHTVTLPTTGLPCNDSCDTWRTAVNSRVLSGTGAEVWCGASGNCTLWSTTTGPTSSITLNSVSNSAYATLAWSVGAGVLDGAALAIGGPGTNALIENNIATHFNQFVQLGCGNSKVVVRNNTEGPNSQYGWQHHDGILSCGTNAEILNEGNFATGQNTADNRVPIGLAEDVSGGPCNDSQWIHRFNYTYNSKGSGASVCGALSPTAGVGMIAYNNDLGVNGTSLLNSGGAQLNTGGGTNNGFATNYAFNNLWYNACCGSGPVDPYQSSGNVTVTNDLYWNGSPGTRGKPCSLGASRCSASGIVNADPKLNNVSSGDYHLQAGSPAIGAGAAATTANGSGSSSTSLTVNNPYPFQDGWAGVNPDCIAVGTVSNTVCIAENGINYATGVITLVSAISWNNGDHVWLFSKSDGVQVLYGAGADIGAFPYVPGGASETRPR